MKGCVVPRPGATLDPADGRAWGGARLARFTTPELGEVREALPPNLDGPVVLLRSPA